MLIRRSTRIKTMQALYSLNRNSSLSIEQSQKNLRKALDTYIDLYHYIIFNGYKVVDFLNTDASIKASKFLPTDSDREINLKLLDNVYVKALEGSEEFMKLIDKNRFANLLDTHVINTLYKELIASEEYKHYISNKLTDSKDDHAIIKFLFENIVIESDLFQQHLEDHFPTWQDDGEFVVSQVSSRIDKWKKSPEKLKVIYKKDNAFDEIQEFANNLLIKTADRDEELTQNIGRYLKNWDENRLALLDTILMKMALSELLYFKEIPVKVSINEYIDISKVYSTPKSKEFINGILDKLMKDLSNEGRIVKVGRGLKN